MGQRIQLFKNNIVETALIVMGIVTTSFIVTMHTVDIKEPKRPTGEEVMTHDQNRNNKHSHLKKKDLTYTSKLKLTRVVDGDTVKAASVQLGFGISLGTKKKPKTIRLGGINTPENTGKEKEAGKLVSAFLHMYLVKLDLVPEDENDDPVEGVWFRSWDDIDNFGRLLGDIITPDGVNVNQMLLDKGLAKVYVQGEHFSEKESLEVIVKAKAAIAKLSEEKDDGK